MILRFFLVYDIDERNGLFSNLKWISFSGIVLQEILINE